MKHLILFGSAASIAIVVLLALLPYFHTGFFPTHDGEWAVVRLTDMFRLLKDGQIPPRFSGNLNFGYGYPLFNFAYPFPYYLGVLIHSLGVGFVSTIKIIFAGSVVVSAIGMFLLSKSFWKSTLAGLISSILYVYLPYHFVDLYVRGSIGESIAFALFPLILYCLFKLTQRSSLGIWFVSMSVSYGVLILSHNIMAILFTPIIIMFVMYIWILHGKKTIVSVVAALLSGLLLSLFFWLPALLEKQYILLSVTPIADRSLYFVTLAQLIFPSWGYGTPTESGAFTYHLGFPHLVAFVVSVLLVLLSKKLDKHTKSTSIMLMTGVCLFVLLLFSFTAPLWNALPFLSEINYPWTMLAPIGFLMCFLAGFLTIAKWSRYIGIGLAILAIVMFLPYAKPSRYIDKGDMFYLTNDATTTSSNELMPLWVTVHPKNRVDEKVQIVKGVGKVTDVVSSSNQFSFHVVLVSDSTVRVNTIYYPGWKIFANNIDQKITYSNPSGTMEFALDSGTYTIAGKLTETPVRLLSNSISVLTGIGLFAFTTIQLVTKKKKHA